MTSQKMQKIFLVSYSLIIVCLVSQLFIFPSYAAPSCTTYVQQNSCNSSPDGPANKSGATFLVTKCGSPAQYTCFDSSKGQYYTQADHCSVGPLGDVTKTGHVFLVRKLTVGGKDIFSCVADCTVNPGLPHCPNPTNSPAPSSSQLMGDVNKDGQINVVDYSLIIGCYGSKLSTDSCVAGSKADINKDGVVDGIDYNIWLRAFLGVE